MTDKHLAEFFSKSHFWVVIDLFVMYWFAHATWKSETSEFNENFLFLLDGVLKKSVL